MQAQPWTKVLALQAECILLEAAERRVKRCHKDNVRCYGGVSEAFGQYGAYCYTHP